ncbi:MAG: nitrate reductase, partial [Comamonas sp.]
LHAAFPNAFPDVGAFFKHAYDYAWFIGLFIAAVVYRIGMASHVAKSTPALSKA